MRNDRSLGANKPGENPSSRSTEISAGDIERLVGSTIGQRVREHRLDLGLNMTQLAERAGISKGMLSKVENAQASPSLATLARLATALSVPVTAFFRGMEEERDAIFVPADEGLDIEHPGGARAGHRYQLLGALRGPNPPLEPVLVTLISQSEVFPLYQHQGTEFLYMLEGRMEYGYGTARYVLASGDALQFEGDAPHGPVHLMELPIRFLSMKAFGSRERLDARRPTG